MEKNKYYTPDIKEFRVGFECEFFNHMQDKIWKKEICDMDLISLAYDCYEHGVIEWEDDITQTFRVKLLDREDIESFGFIRFEDISEYVQTYKKDIWFILWQPETEKHGKGALVIEDTCAVTHFRGYIKNKSELEVVLKQIGII